VSRDENAARKPVKINETEIAQTIQTLVAERGAGKTICPSEVARAIAGEHPDAWGRLMQPVRRVAVRLAKAGEVAIMRKGKPIEDPDDFKGIYRIGPGAAPTE
jgi:hypothetical protein